MSSNFRLELIDMFFAFLFLNFSQLLLLNLKRQIRLINGEIGIDRLSISNQALELLLIIGVVFEPVSQVLDGLVGLLGVNTGKTLGDDFADLVLLEVGEGLFIHDGLNVIYMLCYESYILLGLLFFLYLFHLLFIMT